MIAGRSTPALHSHRVVVTRHGGPDVLGVVTEQPPGTDRHRRKGDLGVGGASHLWSSYRALRSGGRLVWLGSVTVETKGLRVGATSMR